MPIKILMPALSPTMTEGNLAKWLKKEGDKIKPGEVIAEVETDKATMEMEAVEEGILARILIPSGSQNVLINSVIAVVLEEGEGIEELDKMDLTNTPLTKEPQSDIPKKLDITPIKEEKSKVNDRIFISPLAKRIATQNNVNISNLKGSGPHGRIIKSDVLNAKSEVRHQRDEIESTIIPHTNVRKIIAKRLLESKQNVPHFYLSIECMLDKLLELREEMNHLGANNYKLSVNDFIIKASALAMLDVPEVNSSWSEDGMISYNNIDICVAVASPNGLITPVIKNADCKGMKSLSNEMKDLAAKARENKLKPEEFQGGGFTISNLGMFGIKNFSAIINPPQSCILAVGQGSKRPVVEGDEITIQTVMDVTLSCDHRVVDGAVGANFLASFKKYIENPIRIILKETSCSSSM